MANKGTYTALQQLRPIEADFGKIAKDEEKARIDVLDKKALKDQAAKEERDKISFDAQGNIVTGIDSLDFALYKGFRGVSKKQHEDWIRARNDPKFAKSDEYLLRNKNRNNYSKNLKLFTDQYKTFADQITAMGGDLAGWNEDVREQIGGFFVKERVEFIENEFGEPLARIALHDPESEDGYKRDANGEIMTKTVGLPEVLKGLGDYDIVPKVDITKVAQTLGEKFGKSETANRSGYTITKEQRWEDKKEDALNAIKGELGSVKNPTALAKRLWADEEGRTKDNWDEKAYNIVAEEMLALVKPYYDEVLDLSYNYAGSNAMEARAHEDNKNAITPSIVVQPDSGKPKVVAIPGVNKPGYPVSFGDGGVVIEDEKARTTKITNIYVTADGEIYANKTVANLKLGADGKPVEAPDATVTARSLLSGDTNTSTSTPKGWEMKEEKGVKMSVTDLTNLAKNRSLRDKDGKPFKDAKALKDFLKGQYNGAIKNDSSESNTKKSSGGAAQFNKKG